MIKKSIGFNWGTCALSTSHWSGVSLRSLLIKCGIDQLLANSDEIYYVCFEGEETLPKGTYGTSITLSKALDPTADVLIAYEQNGYRLAPDHGYRFLLL
jgi:nitrate reductase (NAD(P)H)